MLRSMTPASSWVVLALAAIGAFMTVTALVRGERLGWGNPIWFVFGWLTSELAVFHIAGSMLIAAAFFLFSDAYHHAPGEVALVLFYGSWCGLVIAQLRARPTPTVLEHALADALGPDYRNRIPAARRAQLREAVTWQDLARPFALRRGPVEWLRDRSYPGGHERNALDIYRPAGGCSGAPVLMQIHGGAWTFGNKHEQALPLIYYLAARGWVVVSPNYRLSPASRFPDHLIDCKRAFAWVREHIAEFGGDPSFIAVTGGSAGGHLTALLGLTPNDARLQPGFEGIDTRPAACVPFYGVYDFLDRHHVNASGPRMVEWLEKTVMPCAPNADPALWDLASPIAQVRSDAPPFFVLHGTHDSLASVAEARLFVDRLRAISREPVAYAELAGAQHAWEIFRSVRAVHSVHAVARFLEWCRATRATRPAAPPDAALDGA